MKELKERKNSEKKAGEDQIEEERLQQKPNEEKRLQIMKTELQQTFEQNTEGNKGRQQIENLVRVKLPKLIISKLEGTNLDCFKFQSQFETEIDFADLTSASKFSYLKELVIPKVRALIDGLPFNIEGYKRAKNYFEN